MSRTLKIFYLLIVIAWINLALSIINIVINNTCLRGFIYGINFVNLSISMLVIIDVLIEKRKNNKRMKEKYKEITNKKFGFREDFDWETRFDLKTQVGDYTISTVDLGINHQWDDDLPPLYYETKIFSYCEENGVMDYQERYATKEEARKGHKKAIKYVKENLKEEK